MLPPNSTEATKDRGILPLVVLRDTTEPTPPELLAVFEPVFSTSEASELRFPAEWNERLDEFLSHSVARDPNDLRSHTRRILVAVDRGEPGRLCGALIDLFIALGTRGEALRKRMLGVAKPKLRARDFQGLSEILSGYRSADRFPFVEHSVLAKGTLGSVVLTRPESPQSHQARDPLVEAREYIEYSQIDAARVVLERAIVTDPGREELHLELLDLYRSTRDRLHFWDMAKKLEELENPFAKAWEELAATFGQPG